VTSAIKKEATGNPFFSISLLAAAITSFFHTPSWEYIDFKVILCLFDMMVVVKAFEEYGLLRHVAVRLFNSFGTERGLTWALSLASFVLAMFLTNDVALLTMVPILIAISRESNYSIIFPCVLATVAANLGSSVTPFGNPQNLFLYSFYGLNVGDFFRHALPLGVVSALIVFMLGFIVKPKKIHVAMMRVSVSGGKRNAAFSALGVLTILGVLGVLSYQIVFAAMLLGVLLLDARLLKKVDYRLLATFACIFVAVGNLAHIPALKGSLTRLERLPSSTFLSSMALSQFISNVPSAVAIAPFTRNIWALFYGVNIGGLGTPVASLASVIAFSLFGHAYPEKGRAYMAQFLLLNVGCLLLLGVIFFFVKGIW
jgi:Na+/H+ antiporter NhaD/arsenite permease-like protein